MSVEIINGVTAVVTHEFKASPDRLFRAFTDPGEAARWWWGAEAPNPSAEIDLKVGGRFRVGRDAPANDDSGWGADRWFMSGVFIEIEPPRRLVYTLHWEGPVGYNQTGAEVLDEAAVVTFEATAEGSRVTYRHIGIPDDGVSAPEHGRAVAASLRDLAAMVEE